MTPKGGQGRVLVTGANGFVGVPLCEALHQSGWQVTAAVRETVPALPDGVRITVVGDLAQAGAPLAEAVADSDLVINLVGRAHRQADETAYQRDNLATLARLVGAMRANGVRRLIHLSSIKALADVSARPLAPDADPAPTDAYGRSKLQAEQWLQQQSGTQLAVRVVRPPLVVGAGARGNLRSLLKSLARPVPLPLGRALAPRSLLGLRNLCDLLVHLAETPVDQDYAIVHARDDDEPSVAELLRRCGSLMGREPLLLPVPRFMMRAGAVVTGRQAMYERLFQPLRVSDAASREQFGWQPRFPLEQSLQDLVTHGQST